MLALSSGLQSHQAASGAGKPLSRAAKPSGEPRRSRILAKFEGGRQKPRRRDATPLRRHSWKAWPRSPDKTVRPARASAFAGCGPPKTCGARKFANTARANAAAREPKPLPPPSGARRQRKHACFPLSPSRARRNRANGKRETRARGKRRREAGYEARLRALKRKQKREIFFFQETPARCAGFFFSACPKLRSFAVRSCRRGAPCLRTGLRTGFCAPIVKTFLGRFAKQKNFSPIFQSIAKKNPSML